MWELLVHDLRRSAIRNITLAGVPQNVFMAISGHKTIAVFLRHNIIAPKPLHTAMQAAELRRRADLQANEQKSPSDGNDANIDANQGDSGKPPHGQAYEMNGAGDRDRTGDIQLGKLAFYR